MSSLDLFDRLRRRLSARGVPPAYVANLLDELDDHYRQSLAAGRSDAEALAALGVEEEIIQTTLESLRRDSFVGRHRIAFFVIAPILLYPIALIFVGLPLGLSGQWLVMQADFSRTSRLIHLWKWATEISVNLALPIGCLLAVRWIGRRSFCGRRFLLVACGEIVAWSLASATWIRLPNVPTGKIRFQFGIGLGWPLQSGFQRLLLALYLATAIWLLIRRAKPIGDLQIA